MSEKLKIKDLKDLIKNLEDSDEVFVRDIILSAFTFSIYSGGTIHESGVTLNSEFDADILFNEKHKPKLPEKSDNEKILDNIRKQTDYTEQKFYNGGYIDYILESSAILGQTAKMTFLYNENHGGRGTLLEIL